MTRPGEIPLFVFYWNIWPIDRNIACALYGAICMPIIRIAVLSTASAKNIHRLRTDVRMFPGVRIGPLQPLFVLPVSNADRTRATFPCRKRRLEGTNSSPSHLEDFMVSREFGYCLDCIFILTIRNIHMSSSLHPQPLCFCVRMFVSLCQAVSCQSVSLFRYLTVPVSVSPPSLYLCYPFPLSLSPRLSFSLPISQLFLNHSINLSVHLPSVLSCLYLSIFSVCAVCASCYCLRAFLSVRLSLTCLFLIHSCTQTEMVLFRKLHVLFYFNACSFEEAVKY